MMDSKMPIALQCKLANVSRATHYAQEHPKRPAKEELALLAH